MEPNSSILAWRIPWTEEPSGLQSMGSQRVRHKWETNSHVLIICSNLCTYKVKKKKNKCNTSLKIDLEEKYCILYLFQSLPITLRYNILFDYQLQLHPYIIKKNVVWPRKGLYVKP